MASIVISIFESAFPVKSLMREKSQIPGMMTGSEEGTDHLNEPVFGT